MGQENCIVRWIWTTLDAICNLNAGASKSSDGIRVQLYVNRDKYYIFKAVIQSNLPICQTSSKSIPNMTVTL